MSQNDMSIANASGATVRADINSALQALASQNSGAAAPGTTYANMWWHDDTNDIMKIRDEANTAWVNAFSKVASVWTPYINGVLQGTMSTLAYTAINQNLTMSAKSFLNAGTSIASAATVDLAAAAGNTVDVTGVVTITGLGTVQSGAVFYLVFAGILTFTYNATSLILPGSASITTAADDVAIMRSKGAGNWQCIAYIRKSGTALSGGTAATQAEMEAASSTTVFATPGRTQYHPGVAKCWGNFDWAGGTNASHNITSTTDSGVGRVTVTIATDFSSAAWDCNVDVEYTAAQSPIYNSQAAGTVELRNYDAAGTIFDVTDISFAGHGDQ